MTNTIRPIAIHLPQFHPIPENDAWWGKGFTEWTNVAKAKPLFKGHYQPHLPADLGFYDLRLEEARLAQEALAKQYGIYGFCYYHYWFNGKRILYEPVERKLRNPKEDLPFMLCWANENWTRRWDGLDQMILLEQKYNKSDALNHIRHLMPYFRDHRYIKIGKKPVFCIYKAELIDNLEEYVEIFKNEARREGIELYLVKFETGGHFYKQDYFDASVEFQPFADTRQKYGLHLMKKINFLPRKILYKLFQVFGLKELAEKRYLDVYNFDYRGYIDFICQNYRYPDYKRYPCVMPGWDNTARRGKNAIYLANSTPEHFEKWVKFHANNFNPFSQEENFLFVNAWNEWAEGNHLEPCAKWGKSYLEVIKKHFT